MRNSIIYSLFLSISIILDISIIPVSFGDSSEIIITPINDSALVGICGPEREVECYDPNLATIDVGGVVIFSNTDLTSHIFISGKITDDKIGNDFDSGILNNDETFTWIPEFVGEINYFCPIHPWMQGLIIVKEELHNNEEEKSPETQEELYVEMPPEESVFESKITPIPEPLPDIDKAAEVKCGAGTIVVNGFCKVVKSEPKGGGCLIATAAYGTELAPQVQFLREIRDNTIMSTASGMSFMTGFNQMYYSFSPFIADMERENPMFQEAVRAFITPMVSTLSIMTLAEDGSEGQVLGLGISVIALNLAIYFGLPMFGILKFYQYRENN